MTNSAASAPEGSLWIAIKRRWRGWLRAIHRDVGYLAVGLTLIYAAPVADGLGRWDCSGGTLPPRYRPAPCRAAPP